MPFWRVSPDGEIRSLVLTHGPWVCGRLTPLPTALGWLIGTPLDGVYSMRGVVYEKVSPGQVLDVAVSPDGCRAALEMHLCTVVQCGRRRYTP